MKIRITAAAPVVRAFDCNHLAMCLARSEADGHTYRGAEYADASGNRYYCASWMVEPEWLTAAQSALTRPLWDEESQIVDLAAAARAQAILVFSSTPVAAAPDKLTAVSGMQGPDAIAAMGLTKV